MAFLRINSALDFSTANFDFLTDAVGIEIRPDANLNFAPFGVPGFTAQDIIDVEQGANANFTFFWALVGENLSLDASGVPVGGRLTGFLPYDIEKATGDSTFGENLFVGFDVSMDAFVAAALTRRSSDDRAILQQILAGDDQMYLSGRSDAVFSGEGNDLISGDRGNDTLAGDGGNDTVNGGAGGDVLDGGSGNDRLLGGTGADILTGGRGKDRLTGGADADTFRFDTASGRDRITDFDGDLDVIHLTGGVLGQPVDITDVAGGVQVVWGASTILVLGITAADLEAGDLVII